MAKYERQLYARASELAEYLNRGIKEDNVEVIDTSVSRRDSVSVYLTLYACRAEQAVLSLLVVGGSELETTVTAISPDGGSVGRIETLVERFIAGETK